MDIIGFFIFATTFCGIQYGCLLIGILQSYSCWTPALLAKSLVIELKSYMSLLPGVPIEY